MNALSLQTKPEESTLIPLKYVYGGLALSIITLVAASIITNYLIENYFPAGYVTVEWALHALGGSALAVSLASSGIISSIIEIACRSSKEKSDEDVVHSTEVR